MARSDRSIGGEVQSLARRNSWKKHVVVAFANEDGSSAMRLDTDVDVMFIESSREFYVTSTGICSTAGGQHQDLSLAILDWLRVAILDLNPTWNSYSRKTEEPKKEPSRGLLPASMHPEIDRLIAQGDLDGK